MLNDTIKQIVGTWGTITITRKQVLILLAWTLTFTGGRWLNHSLTKTLNHPPMLETSLETPDNVETGFFAEVDLELPP